MHDIDSALRVIRARDATAATLAYGLWEVMRRDAAHPRVTRYDVQRMLWGAVPHALRRPDGPQKFPDRHAVSAAFAELLDLLGYPSYAELCRAQATREILDAAEDETRCAALAADAWRASGVQPPDTPILTWIEHPGPVEEALHGTAGRILEDAIDAGAVKLGAPGAESMRIALTLRVLTSPDNEGADTWFVRLFEERLDTWIPGHGSQTRREMLVRLRPEVRHTPDVTGAGLPALERLLEACRDGGAPLTERGYLPTGLVHELAGVMPACRELHRTSRSESAWPPVRVLRRLATEFGLVMLAGRRLRLTAVGRDVVDDPDTLLMCVGERVVTFTQSPLGLLQEVILAALLLENFVEPDRLVEKVSWAFEEGSWEESGEQPGPRHAVVGASLFVDQLRVLDTATVQADTHRIGLTDAGRSVARWALRARVMLRAEPG